MCSQCFSQVVLEIESLLLSGCRWMLLEWPLAVPGVSPLQAPGLFQVSLSFALNFFLGVDHVCLKSSSSVGEGPLMQGQEEFFGPSQFF